jgi:hypothetical protein
VDPRARRGRARGREVPSEPVMPWGEAR